MNIYKPFLFAFAIAVAFISCEKQADTPQLASLNVVNAAIDAGQVKVNYFGQNIVWATYTGTAGAVNFGANNYYSVPSGSLPLVVVPSTDTLNPVFNSTIETVGGGIYTLYLTGQKPNYEKLYIKEDITQYADSSVGIRFINLSPNSTPVTINIASTPTVAEFSNIAYKQSTSFKTYQAKSTNATYVFEVRNASTAALLASYTVTGVPATATRNITLAIKGLQGTTTGTNAFSVQRVNNYQ